MANVFLVTALIVFIGTLAIPILLRWRRQRQVRHLTKRINEARKAVEAIEALLRQKR